MSSGFGETPDWLPGVTEGSLTVSGRFGPPPPELVMPHFIRIPPENLVDFPPFRVGQEVRLSRNGIELDFEVVQIDGPGELWLWLLVDEDIR